MDLEDQATSLMPKGWGDPEGWLNKFLKAKGIPREEQVTAEQVMAAQNGDKLPQGGSNKSNRFAAQPIKQIPEVTVNGIDRRWRYDRRQQDHGNGHKVISDTFFDYYDGGNRYLGDLAPIRGGRTIYVSPKGNDTLYWNQPEKWIDFADGFMPVGKNQPGAKRNFFKNLKRPLIKTHQNGGEFKENLNPPTDGVVGELKRNIRNGLQQGKRMAGSVPLNILLGGIGSGMTGINIASKAKQFANWLVKDQNPGLDQISALGWIGAGPAMGIAMFDPFRWSKDAKNEDEIKKYGASSRYDRERRAEEYRSAEPLRR